MCYLVKWARYQLWMRNSVCRIEETVQKKERWVKTCMMNTAQAAEWCFLCKEKEKIP